MNEFFSLFMNDADWFVGTLVIGGIMLLVMVAIFVMIFIDYRK